jgi:hypothetical protein
MPCDGGVGTCAYDPCGQFACLNEDGYCSTSCQEDDEEGTVPAGPPLTTLVLRRRGVLTLQ